MKNLKAYIDSRASEPMRKVAEDLGVSRPYLYDLLSNKRQPSLAVALRIEAATCGAVRVSSWDNFSQIVAAVNAEKSHASGAT